MGFSENLVILVGGLGKDAETRFTTGNTSVTSFSIATEHSFKKNDEWENATTWHNCVAFNLSDWIKDKLKKGEKIYLRGRISNTSYTDKDGNKKYKSEVIVDSRSINPLGRRSEPSNQSSVSTPPQVENNDDLPF
jgi:single-strand DNA-binding protein